MTALADTLTQHLEPPLPADPKQFMRDLLQPLAEERQRNIQLVFKDLPRGTASGLWLCFPEADMIVVEDNTTPLHQMVILGHEIWHMVAGGGCRGHQVPAGAKAAARSFDETLDRVMAARTDFALQEEKDAEAFGLRLASRLRPYLTGAQAQMPLGGVTSRLQASFGGPAA
ncbi:hypothetical protein GCM10010232_49490 [Streptomyces amakusaensis]|uniref:Toxin-antitoxin system, toxin component n=1 Tax=Streptomyces amakusaensis TaxID=67271 RepID=A0ABW0AJY6_9ACTN